MSGGSRFSPDFCVRRVFWLRTSVLGGFSGSGQHSLAPHKCPEPEALTSPCFGRKSFIRNYHFDKLVNEDQARLTQADRSLQLHHIRDKLVSAVINLVESTDKQRKLLNNPPYGSPVSGDDRSASDDADRDSDISIV